MKSKNIFYIIGGVLLVAVVVVVAVFSMNNGGNFQGYLSLNKLTVPKTMVPIQTQALTPSWPSIQANALNPQAILSNSFTTIAAFKITTNGGPVIFDGSKGNRIILDYTLGGGNTISTSTYIPICVLRNNGNNVSQTDNGDITVGPVVANTSGSISQGTITFKYFPYPLEIDPNAPKDFDVSCSAMNITGPQMQTLGTYFIKAHDPLNWSDRSNSNITNDQNQYMPTNDILTLGFLKSA